MKTIKLIAPMKKLAYLALSLIVIASLCIPVVSFAESTTSSNASNAQQESIWDSNDNAQTEQSETLVEDSATSEEDDPLLRTSPKGNCTATIKYYENMTWEDPDQSLNDDGRYLLGTRTITGLTEGTVLNAWDYVVDIKGFFFFDGWPGKLTVSSDPSKNVFELIYYREWNSAYTVNYYMMLGANLTASTWSEALSPTSVRFVKLGSETFDNQPYGALVKGDAYQYRVDGTYVVDTYPAEIRLGSDTDNNVLNVLYVPDSTNLPDDIEIPDEIASEIENGTIGSTGSSGGSNANLPADEVLTEDEMEGLLPEGLTQEEIDELFKDFIGSSADAGKLEITDEMLAHPQTKEEAQERLSIFYAGYEQGKAQASEDCEQGDAQSTECPFDHWLCIVIIILLLILAIIGYVLYGRSRKRISELEKQLEEGASPGNASKD